MKNAAYAAPRNDEYDQFARRFRVATTGLADVLTPSQVRAFSDCELRWFYEHLLGLPDPPTAMQALDRAIRVALMANFRHKLDAKEDLQTEGVVGLFRRAWEQQQNVAVFCDDESPESLASTGEALIRLYMQETAPSIQPESIEQPFEGVLGSVRIHGQIDIVDVDGAIIDILTATGPPARIDPMHRFELGTCTRLVYGASGVVRSDILVASSPAQHITQTWQATAADHRWMDELFPLAQEAMRRGYYMPHRNSTGCSRHQCPHWRRCEQDFGGVVES